MNWLNNAEKLTALGTFPFSQAARTAAAPPVGLRRRRLDAAMSQFIKGCGS
jgi:hypothetical protein